jgi:phosphoglycolate phosphatase
MEAVIFDLDGTIIDTIDGIGYAANLALKKFGYEPCDRIFYVSAIGNGARALIAKAIGPDSANETVVTKVLEYFLNEYENHWEVDLKVYDGMIELIDQLLKKGIKIGVNTNKPNAIAQKIVRSFFNENQILEIVGSQKAFPNKPNPTGTLQTLEHINAKPEMSFYIGDSIVDIQTAKNAGMLSIICTWGYGDQKEFTEADYVVNHPSEILKLISSLD